MVVGFFLSKTHSLKLNKEAINESCVSLVKDCVIAPRWSETDGGACATLQMLLNLLAIIGLSNVGTFHNRQRARE